MHRNPLFSSLLIAAAFNNLIIPMLPNVLAGFEIGFKKMLLEVVNLTTFGSEAAKPPQSTHCRKPVLQELR